jgi:magnesium chelatase family protein
VRAARRLQLERAGRLNADLSGDELKVFCGLDRRCRLLMAQARSKFELSARAVHRLLRVARTIADLENETGSASRSLEPVHIAEALQLRRAV